MARRPRKQLLVDVRVQGALALRVCFYWLLCIVGTTIALLCWRITASGPARLFYLQLDDLWFQYGPVVLILAGLLPLIVYDMVRLSHRFTGPVFRLRNCMRKLAQGEHVEPIHFRKGDMWQELADEFNSLLTLVEELKSKTQVPTIAALESPNSEVSPVREVALTG